MVLLEHSKHLKGDQVVGNYSPLTGVECDEGGCDVAGSSGFREAVPFGSSILGLAETAPAPRPETRPEGITMFR